MFSSKHFRAIELRCKCKYCQRKKPHNIKKEALDMLEELRTKIGRPLIINSAYRCSKHPDEAKKLTPGQHNLGTAFDIHVSNGAEAYEVMKFAFEIGFNGIAYGGSFVHVDARKSKGTTWRY